LKKCREELGPLLDGIQLDDYHSSMFNIYFLLRRLLTGFGLVAFYQYPFFQCFCLMTFSIINFVYQFATKPMEEPVENKLELFNEYCILLCAYCMNVFSNPAITPKLGVYLEWTFLAIACGNILVNVIVISMSGCIGGGKDIQRRRM
jgi:hypothetical protein